MKNTGQDSFSKIAGVDEVGRGALAGPVMAVSVHLPAEIYIPGLKDSKQLSKKKRSFFFDLFIKELQLDFGVGIVDAVEIDEKNILQATMQAMSQAIFNMKEPPDHLLIDGNCSPFGLLIDCTCVVQGDQKVAAISCAAIIAKVLRDKVMDEYHDQYPCYAFNANKGYGTQFHLASLMKYGPTPIHRKSFCPVKKFVGLHG